MADNNGNAVNGNDYDDDADDDNDDNWWQW